ncbi:tRNA (adenosine(37)-N6)-threonylcarbamoyltransferase complex dimerization subunit type 1 TsaB [Corynebacterium alimapuense]|uniref:tRNA (Adenosine(37)-N6)-threonylcarbamoyltransferase complex dimerization subunit type 1 TsaB n=1 Tax=Corynebacterium alimapuense TaxID=1576874 RepID=A0A3M8K8H0_9CORY|nr:tRNA (adenosine(37)-N6)-threonylcarbamoyltransferase complex dimerization subunit type 1 TsaB [Corynebacterium alimapuense]RNE48842.1 tRNA (adenosine(37)-N6)-threonylcarbamoyltransferase complex dimerization subunit type 1 TsaB [Corynebacterium alimapuense]
MLVLAIDTSTPDLVTGLVETTTGQVYDRIIRETRAHNEKLTPTVQALLADAGVGFSDLDAIVVGCGPGPFTGLRVGMATAAAFGDALDIAVHGVCSLDAIARRLPDVRTLVATDARRREIYWAIFDGHIRIHGPAVIAPGELLIPHPVEMISVPERLAEQLPGHLADVEKRDLAPDAASLVAVADLEATPVPLVPLYLRRPDAKEPKPRPQSPAIPVMEV